MIPFLRTAGIALLIGFALVGLAFTAVFVFMQFGLLNVPGSIASRNASFATSTATAPAIPPQPCIDKKVTVCAWNETPEWPVVAGGLTKDAAIIDRVSQETGVKSRLIAAVVIPEQIRFFTSEREVFKRYFEPLKILGSLTQFSLGVSGIKQQTAVTIEQEAYDPSAQFYPGSDLTALIAYPPDVKDHDAALYARLTNDKDHYYSYLYTALYIKEVEAQWRTSGFPIDQKPAIIATLFNIGFARSAPNANPEVGGASIAAGGKTYAFGELGGDFYDSDELLAQFPR